MSEAKQTARTLLLQSIGAWGDQCVAYDRARLTAAERPEDVQAAERCDNEHSKRTRLHIIMLAQIDRFGAIGLALLVLVACSTDRGALAPMPDAGKPPADVVGVLQPHTDASDDRRDSGSMLDALDAGSDSGSMLDVLDAGTDAGLVVDALDAGSDSGSMLDVLDAGTDAGLVVDAGPQLNACGGATELPHEPGAYCASPPCSTGYVCTNTCTRDAQYECNGLDAVACLCTGCVALGSCEL